MRLTEAQTNAIREAVTKIYGGGAQVLVFGSRVDDARRGGDIDLLVRPDPDSGNDSIARKIRLLGELERRLGERKIDIVVEQPHDARPIVALARRTGEQL